MPAGTNADGLFGETRFTTASRELTLKCSHCCRYFAETDLALAWQRTEVINRIVREWLRLCRERQTIYFAVNSLKAIQDAFFAAGCLLNTLTGSMTSESNGRQFTGDWQWGNLVLTSCQALQRL